MPDESTNPVGTTQAPQSDQAATSQSGDDFVLDFGDFGNDNAPATEEVQVDLLSSEEENNGDELGFDIDLGSDNQDSTENTEEGVSVGDEIGDGNNGEAQEGEDAANDFDISMDYEGSSTEETVTNEDALVPDEEETVTNEDTLVPDEEETVTNEDTLVPDEEETVSNEDTLVPDEDLSLNFADDANNESENLEATNQSNEGHLFQQIDEGDQNENNFQPGVNDVNESFQPSEDSINTPLFMGEGVNNDVSTDASSESSREMVFGGDEGLNTMEGVASLIEEAPEQRQPEIGDLLSNAPIDLSEELNDIPEDQTTDLGVGETPLDSSEPNQEASTENNVFESSVESLSENIQDNVENSPILEGNNKSPLNESEMELENQNIEQIQQLEVVENKVEDAPQEVSQSDERSEMVNNAASQMSEQNTVTPEINVSTPVELSDVSSNQQEVNSVGSEAQVQSTLSLDQILDTELLSNPQYADNSKASPQNVPASEGGKSKMGLFVGVGLAALACCVAFIAFPSISGDRKAGDVVTDTGAVHEYSPSSEEPHTSSPDLPGDPSGGEESHTSAPDVPESPIVGGGQGSAQVVSFPEGGDEGGDTQPMPYVGYESGEDETPEIQTPQIEEVNAGQILDVILSFKTQGEGYYSYAEQSSDNQLMKYSVRLINVCDNYKDKVNSGEGVDSESFSSFKSTANKIIDKIVTYLGGDEDASVIVEATIGGESSFEGKDEIVDYLEKNR